MEANVPPDRDQLSFLSVVGKITHLYTERWDERLNERFGLLDVPSFLLTENISLDRKERQ